MPKQAPFHSIKDILEKVLPKANWDFKKKKYSLWEQWETLMGQSLAVQMRPLRWAKNILVIGVTDGCWLQELRMMENDLLKKIRQAFPDLVIDGLRWTITR